MQNGGTVQLERRQAIWAAEEEALHGSTAGLHAKLDEYEAVQDAAARVGRGAAVWHSQRGFGRVQSVRLADEKPFRIEFHRTETHDYAAESLARKVWAAPLSSLEGGGPAASTAEQRGRGVAVLLAQFPEASEQDALSAIAAVLYIYHDTIYRP